MSATETIVRIHDACEGDDGYCHVLEEATMEPRCGVPLPPGRMIHTTGDPSASPCVCGRARCPDCEALL